MDNRINGVYHAVSCDDVISKLKDDGDFDKLRIKIIRKIKENEELRNSIVSIVKQSVAINRPGAENTKARQLSDAIHHEVGGKLNEQVSVALWEVIRSTDGNGMKAEITETVKSVYNKLSRSKQMENAESVTSAAGRDAKRTRIQNSRRENDMRNPVRVDDLAIQEQQKEGVNRSVEALESVNVQEANHEQGDGSDEDLDAPPGFG